MDSLLFSKSLGTRIAVSLRLLKAKKQRNAFAGTTMGTSDKRGSSWRVVAATGVNPTCQRISISSLHCYVRFDKRETRISL